MNFRILSLSLVFSFFLFSIVFAQNNDSLNQKSTRILNKKFYFQIGIGYNFPTGLGTLGVTQQDVAGNTSKKYLHSSLGQGVDIGLGLGRKLSQNLGVEMELGYISGTGQSFESQFYINNTPDPYLDKQHNTYTANTFRINPKLLFEVPFKDQNAFYAKLGYLVGFGKETRSATDDWVYNSGQENTGEFKWETTGGVVSGSTMALGFRFLAEKDVSFFMELTGNNLHRTFKKTTMTEASENGKSFLSSKSVYDTETIYVHNAESSTTIDSTKPYQYPAYRSNYSSVGFRIGLIYHF